MPSYEHFSWMTTEDLHCPTLREWRPGAERPELGAGEIGSLARSSSTPDLRARPRSTPPSLAPELASLDEAENRYAQRGSAPARDRRRFARCRASLREILGGSLGKEPASIRFRSVARGKPELDLAT